MDDVRDLFEALLDGADEPLVVPGPLRHEAAYRLMAALGVGVVEPEAGELSPQERGRAAQDYRASRAQVGRRTDDGQTPALCDHCQTEADVTFPAHDPRCPNFPRVEAPVRGEQGERVKVPGLKATGTTAVHARDGSLTQSESRRREIAHQEQAPLRVECGMVGCEWWFEGPSKIAMAMQTEHVGTHGRGGHPKPAEVETISTPAASTASTVRATPSTKVADGGWSRARVTREQAIAALKARAEELGRVPTGVEWQRMEWRPGYKTIVRLFQSWGRALAAAELAPQPAQKAGAKVWTPEAIVEAIRRWAAEHDGEPPKSNDWLKGTQGRWPTQSAVLREFGSWNKGLVAAGFAPRPVGAQPGNRSARADAPARQDVPMVWTVKVSGTGLRYRTDVEALEAADEIEADGERVAREARENGQEGKADQAIDASRELAGKIRAACASYAPELEDVVAKVSTDTSEDRLPEPIPEAKSRQNGDRQHDLALVTAAVGAAPDEKDWWIAEMRVEAVRLQRRSQAFTQIADSLVVLKETEA